MDFFYIVGVLVFFAMSWGLLCLCERLQSR